MSRRQALGVISNNYAGSTTNQQLKPTNTFKPSVFSKNENEPPPWSGKQAKQSDFDFEIFQDSQENKKSSNALQPLSGNSALLKFASKHGYQPEAKKQPSVSQKDNELSAKRSDKENRSIKNEPVIFTSEVDEDEQEAVSERYAKEDYEYEEDAYTSEEDEADDDEDDEEDYAEKNDEVEEEGISRLNLAALVDSSNESCKKIVKEIINTSSELMTMDSSSSTHHDLSASPMLLDDTIKYHSHLSQFEEEECEEEKEERSKRQTIAERESLLVNCLEYKDEILDYMRKMELENRPKANYMKKQQDINSSMRSILVDWLVEVSEEYKLNTETLYLAVNYTDRFLSQMSVLRGKLQLVGTASMYIASKYEEISPPDVSEFVYITDDTYTKKQVLRMEHLLLKVLDFRMNTPTINCFLLHYLRFLKLNPSNTSTTSNLASPMTNQQQELHTRIENLARYLAELTLVDSDTFLGYLPSQIAVSAIYLSLYTLNKPWTKQIADQLGYNFDLSELKSCISDMFKCMQQAAHHPQQAIQEKYKQAKYDYVSLIEAPRALPQFFQ